MTAQTGPHVGRQTPEGRFDLALGQPSPRLLPLAAIARAASHALRTGADPLVLQYGKTQGWDAFREVLATFLSESHGLREDGRIEPGHVMASGAISLSLSLIADVFGRRRGRVVCGDPTYFLAAGIFESAGLGLERIPVDEHGMDVEALASALAKGLRPDLVYCIPTHHNPTATTLPLARRKRLIELAEEYDFWVIADEPYNLLRFEGKPIAPLACLDQGQGRVLSVGSFTKILAPGLRFGWVQAQPSLLERLSQHGVLRSGGAINPVMAATVQQVIESGDLCAHLEHLRTTYAERTQALRAGVESFLVDAKLRAPDGGYFAWLELPPGIDANSLATKARAADIRLCAGTRCGVGQGLDRYLRLAVSFYEADELRDACQRLGSLM